MYFDAVANVDPTRAEIAQRAANVQREERNYVSASAADGLALVYKVYELLSYSDQALADLYHRAATVGDELSREASISGR